MNYLLVFVQKDRTAPFHSIKGGNSEKVSIMYCVTEGGMGDREDTL